MISLLAFSDELTKISASFADKVDAHHTAESKDWDGFTELLRNPRFQAEVKRHGMTDDKLKRYAENVGGYLHSKDVVGEVSSRTSGKTYKIKRLKSGRLACGCADWRYHHSVRNTDCDHIPMVKKAGVEGVLRGALAVHRMTTAKNKFDRVKPVRME